MREEKKSIVRELRGAANASSRRKKETDAKIANMKKKGTRPSLMRCTDSKGENRKIREECKQERKAPRSLMVALEQGAPGKRERQGIGSVKGLKGWGRKRGNRRGESKLRYPYLPENNTPRRDVNTQEWKASQYLLEERSKDYRVKE